MIEGQTCIEPCAICGEPSTEQLVTVPEVVKSIGDGVTVVQKAAVRSHLCDVHAQHVRDGEGWQERMKDKSRRRTAEAKQRLKRDQTSLFDPPRAA